MKFAAFAATLLALALPAFSAPTTTTVPLTWAVQYGDPTTPLNEVACSNGANGLITQGYTNLGDLPAFPNVGGMYPVVWNSTLCGTCWNVTYDDMTVSILAVDYAAKGFVVSEAAENNLTDGLANQIGTIEVVAVQVDTSYCGM